MQGKNPILVGILKGSIPFMAELVKHIDTHIEMDFMMVSSYHGGTASSGVINIIFRVFTQITGAIPKIETISPNCSIIRADFRFSIGIFKSINRRLSFFLCPFESNISCFSMTNVY